MELRVHTMSLADYLAKNYLTADSKPDKKSKKRKRKDGKTEPSGLNIADDDSLGWIANGAARDDDDGPVTGMLSWSHSTSTPLTSPCSWW